MSVSISKNNKRPRHNISVSETENKKEKDTELDENESDYDDKPKKKRQKMNRHASKTKTKTEIKRKPSKKKIKQESKSESESEPESETSDSESETSDDDDDEYLESEREQEAKELPAFQKKKQEAKKNSKKRLIKKAKKKTGGTEKKKEKNAKKKKNDKKEKKERVITLYEYNVLYSSVFTACENLKLAMLQPIGAKLSSTGEHMFRSYDQGQAAAVDSKLLGHAAALKRWPVVEWMFKRGCKISFKSLFSNIPKMTNPVRLQYIREVLNDLSGLTCLPILVRSKIRVFYEMVSTTIAFKRNWTKQKFQKWALSADDQYDPTWLDACMRWGTTEDVQIETQNYRIPGPRFIANMIRYHVIYSNNKVKLQSKLISLDTEEIKSNIITSSSTKMSKSTSKLLSKLKPTLLKMTSAITPYADDVIDKNWWECPFEIFTSKKMHPRLLSPLSIVVSQLFLVGVGNDDLLNTIKPNPIRDDEEGHYLFAGVASKLWKANPKHFIDWLLQITSVYTRDFIQLSFMALCMLFPKSTLVNRDFEWGQIQWLSFFGDYEEQFPIYDSVGIQNLLSKVPVKIQNVYHVHVNPDTDTDETDTCNINKIMRYDDLFNKATFEHEIVPNCKASVDAWKKRVLELLCELPVIKSMNRMSRDVLSLVIDYCLNMGLRPVRSTVCSKN